MSVVHLTLATQGRLPLLPDDASRRAFLHVLGRLFDGRVVLFAVVDDHLHVVLVADEEERGSFARALGLALRPFAPALQPAHIKPVEERTHLRSLVRYLALQPVHHGLFEHPALATGSCIPDLVGARRIPGLRPRLFDLLPRMSVGDVLARVGLPGSLVPPDGPKLRALGAARIVAAAGHAAGAASGLTGKGTAVVTARRVGLALAREAGIHPVEIAAAMELEVDSLRKLGVASTEDVLAARKRLALEHAVAQVAYTAAVRALSGASSGTWAGKG